ncbi:MAG: penicillin-binding protein, partial [Flavobacteriales bacterium]
MKNQTDISIRTWTCFAIMCLIAIGIVVRIFYIQTIESENWTKVGESYVEQVRSITPSRGQIYSEKGSLLATSVPM